MTKAIRKAALNIARWRENPVDFVREEFNAEPDEWQADFLNAYARSKKPRTYAKACKGPGKTTALSWCSWHFLACYSHPKIPATSITGANLRNNLWSEMAKWQSHSEYLKNAFTWRAERIYANDHPETWFMAALTWAQDSDAAKQADVLAGYHADNIMFVLDEMGAYPDAVTAAAEAILATAGTEVNPNAIARIIGAGNPTHLSGPLYRACTHEASLCNVITITGDPDDPKRSKRISVQWARDQIQKWGADNPYVLVNVFGKFPPSSINALLGPDVVEAAMKRVLPQSAWISEQKVLGVDCGGGGHDPSAICPRQGLVHFKPKLIRFDDPKLIAGAVAQSIQKWKPDAVNIDNTGGWGTGVISYLRDWQYPVNAVGFAEKSYDRAFANKRTEMIFNFSHAVRNGGCLPDIPALREACCAQTYTHHKDQMLMEPKDDLKAGIGDTTGFDMLDGYALTHAYPLAKRDPVAEYRQPETGDYDPIRRSQAQNRPPAGAQESDWNPLDSI